MQFSLDGEIANRSILDDVNYPYQSNILAEMVDVRIMPLQILLESVRAGPQIVL